MAILKHHVPLRGNMEAVLRHAANPQRKTIFTRNEIIRNIRNRKARIDGFAATRERLFPTRATVGERIARLKVLPKSKKRGYTAHLVTGLDRALINHTNDEVKAVLREEGFTGIRRGGIKYAI